MQPTSLDTWPNSYFKSDIIPIRVSLALTHFIPLLDSPPPLPTHEPSQTHSLEFPSQMSCISLKVELPAHSHSFHVQVPDSSSVATIKSEISKSCPGEPKVEGQRLIYAGRLLRDDEQVQDIWPVSHPTRPMPTLVGRVTNLRGVSSRALNSREPFTWPYIPRLGRLVRQGGALHRSSRSYHQ